MLIIIGTVQNALGKERVLICATHQMDHLEWLTDTPEVGDVKDLHFEIIS